MTDQTTTLDELADVPDARALAEWAHERGTVEAELRQTELLELGQRDDNDLPLAYMHVRHDGSAVVHDMARYRARPEHVVAAPVLTDPLAFTQYIDRHKTIATTIWADGDRVVAVLDDHDPARTDPAGQIVGDWHDRVAGPAGRRNHTATLALHTAPEWAGWRSLHRQLVGQAQFAEVVEEFAGTILDPDPATMLEVAQSITVASTGQVASGISLRDGALRLTITETLDAQAGTRDHPLTIPTSIRFQARRWLGVPATEMTARLRYRADRNGLKLGLVIDRLEDVEDTYRRNLATSIADTTGCPTYTGTYAGAR